MSGDFKIHYTGKWWIAESTKTQNAHAQGKTQHKALSNLEEVVQLLKEVE